MKFLKFLKCIALLIRKIFWGIVFFLDAYKKIATITLSDGTVETFEMCGDEPVKYSQKVRVYACNGTSYFVPLENYWWKYERKTREDFEVFLNSKKKHNYILKCLFIKPKVDLINFPEKVE